MGVAAWLDYSAPLVSTTRPNPASTGSDRQHLQRSAGSPRATGDIDTTRWFVPSGRRVREPAPFHSFPHHVKTPRGSPAAVFTPTGLPDTHIWLMGLMHTYKLKLLLAAMTS